jgi:hypothetical protein
MGTRITAGSGSLGSLVCVFGGGVFDHVSQALQAELRGAAERVDALLAFGEGLAQRTEPRAWASLERILRALGAHRDAIFRRLWKLQAQLVSYSLVWHALVVPSPDPNPQLS